MDDDANIVQNKLIKPPGTLFTDVESGCTVALSHKSSNLCDQISRTNEMAVCARSQDTYLRHFLSPSAPLT